MAMLCVGAAWHDHVPVWQRPADPRRGRNGFVCDPDGVGTDRQMRAMLLDHSHRQDEQGPLTIECLDLRKGELLKLEDSRTWSRAIALRR